MAKQLLLAAALLLAPLPGAAPFSLPRAGAPRAVCNHGGAPAFQLAASSNTDADDANPSGSSDLKSLLPTPKKRTLRLDKFGRRIHDLTDDGTAKFAKEPSGAAAVGYSGSGGEGGSSLGSTEAAEGMSSDASVTSELGAGEESVAQSPSLSDMLADEEGTAARSPKAAAADAATASFGEVRQSSDLKALLPTRKMRFMKLDKFGRRVQRMEDDGTVHMEKAPTQPKAQSGDGEAPVDEEGSSENKPVDSPSLAEILGKEDKEGGDDAVLGAGKKSADLKELLPKQKMQFLKLDKFGRRVQRMEDDGTVTYAKEPGKSTGSKIASHRGTREGFVKDGAANVDLGSAEAASGAANYGNLRVLLPQKPVWTKLDFHGRPVEDERRTKKAAKPADTTEPISSGSGLKELLPKREVWTKLDFHGRPVPDERRTKKVDTSSPSGEGFNSGSYSNLSTLLPERKIKWRKQGELLSSGSAPTVSENTRGLRQERQAAMKDEVIAAANEGDPATEQEEDVGDDADSAGAPEKGYMNLSTLLPERKIKWRKQEELLSSGSAPTVSENTRGLRDQY